MDPSSRCNFNGAHDLLHSPKAVVSMTYIVGRYISTLVIKNGLFALTLLLVLFSILGLVDILEDVGKGSFTVVNAVSVILLEVPNRVLELLPISVLLGCVMGLGTLASNQEASAMRASGLAVISFSKLIVYVTFAISLLAVLAQNYVVPSTEQQAQRIKAYILEQTNYTADGFWSKKNNQLIRIEAFASDNIVGALEIYELSQSGNVLRAIRAENAQIRSDGLWELKNVTETRLNSVEAPSKRTLPSLTWKSFFTSDQLGALVTPPRALSTFDLIKYIRTNQNDGVGTRTHQLVLWQRLGFPLMLVAMALIGVPIALSSVQFRSTSSRSLLAGAIGIIFYLLQQISGHLAALLELSPAMSVLVPPIIILLLAIQYTKKI